MQHPDDHEHTHGHDHAHHDHTHDHDHRARISTTSSCACRALETLLMEKGYVDPAALDVFIETYEKKIGPRNGAKVVAKSWSDPTYREWLLKDATAAIRELGFAGRQSEHMVALENTPDTHNMVVCTLCSCYPVTVLGLPPVWYKSAPYRSRAVIDPRSVLAEFGLSAARDDAASAFGIPPPRSAISWSRCAPQAPTDWSEERLADLVTRDSMIGTGQPLSPMASQ